MRRWVRPLALLAYVAALGAGMAARHSASGQAPAFRCGTITPKVTVSAVMPKNFFAADGQAGADCMAWQEFIFLNWRADPNNPGEPDPTATAANFGVPNDYLTVWESYPTSAAVMTPGSTVRRALAASHGRLMQLSITSKLDNIALSGIGQAGNGAWLTDQLHGLTYYQVHVNKDEAQYVSANQLQTGPGQLTCTQGAKGFNLPAGSGTDYTCTGTRMSFGDNVGAVELKAAWIELTDAGQYPNFLTAQAQISPPGGPSHQGVVGLVGLHIIHKVPNAQQFVWATFEHVNNAPQSVPAAGTPRFNFYNPACDPKTDRYRCEINHQPSPAPDDPYDAPVQVMRIIPIGTRSAAPLNAYVWSQLPATSVFRNYQLVDALWPQQNTPISPGATTPLTYGNSISERAPLVNTTLETYFQSPPAQRACLDCHKNAYIAPTAMVRGLAPPRLVQNARGRPARLLSLAPRAARAGSSARPASDYSFVFFNLGR